MTTYTENNWTAHIELTKGRHSVEVLKMCRSMDDVQRCAAMGDFRIARYDLHNA
jgi:hypothetical protein